MSVANESWPFEWGRSPFRMKGIAYRSFVQFLEADVPGGLDGVAARLSSDALRRFLRQPFLAASWYDAAPSVPLNEAAADLLGRDVGELMRERGRIQAEEDLAGVYSWLLKVASPRAVATRLPRLTARYFDWGGVEIEEESPEHVVAVRTGVPRYLAVWYDRVATPFLAYALERAGARELRMTTSTRLDAPAHGVRCCALAFDMRWR
ncbi:MAG TPA: hypothetical protein RMH99_12425 [Sandaracinaceae bacterium LLY-WYZ-13_1]|nr:hypothetical protein [Sandaracinaceae bacterium LLY-WYZ-13_1]